MNEFKHSVGSQQPHSVIPTGVARFLLACGFCTPGYGVEGPLFDFHNTETDPTSTKREKLTLFTEYSKLMTENYKRRSGAN